MRTILYLLLCASLASGVNRIAHNGGFGNIDDTWLAFLRGNVERVAKGNAPTLPPLLIEITQDGGATESWPPTALDYALLLDRLTPLSPGTVAIGSLPPPTDDLESEILADKAEALQRVVFPSILGVPPPLEEPEIGIAGLEIISAEIVSGDISRLPSFSTITPAKQTSGSAGFTKIDLGSKLDKNSIPLLARTTSGTIAAGFGLVSILEHTRKTAANLEIELGNRIRFKDGTTIPISPSGTTTFSATLPPLPTLDASTLFDPTGSTAPQTSPLPPLAGRLVFLGEESATSPARAAAHIATAALDQKWVRPLPRPLEIALWIALSLTALTAYKASPSRARSTAFFTATGYITAALLIYSIAHIWWPIPVPAALILLICISALLRRETSPPDPA